MKVLGIDPGSITTGYGVVGKDGGGRLLHVCNGVVALNPASPLPGRLHAIFKTLNSVIEEHRPDAVAVESLFFSKNPRSAILLGEARGAALLSAASMGIDVYEYSPSSVKLAVSGYGNASKEQVKKMVGMLIKGSGQMEDDASDALAIAICHIHHHRINSLNPVSAGVRPGPLRRKRSSGC